MKQVFKSSSLEIELITSSVKKMALSTTKPKILVGTHALLEKKLI